MSSDKKVEVQEPLLEQEPEKKPGPKYSNMGYIYALIAGATFGVGMFLFGLMSELGNDGTILLYWFGFLLNFLLFFI